MGACVLEEPRQVLLFTGKSDTVELLNKAFVIAPAEAERAFRALFRAFPHVRRIRVEVLFPPSALHCPKLVLFASNHMVVDLPPTVDEYRASLGKRRRRTLRESMNRLARDFPELTTEVFPSAGDDRAPKLFKQLLEWKTARFRERGLKTYWDEYPEMVDSFLALLRRRGEVHLTTVSGDSVALAFVFPVGEAICAQESAFDPVYGRYGLGTFSQHWVMCSAISRGYASVNMLWGGEKHKSHFAATPRLASAIVVFRDRRAFLSSAQTWAITWRSCTSAGEQAVLAGTSRGRPSAQEPAIMNVARALTRPTRAATAPAAAMLAREPGNDGTSRGCPGTDCGRVEPGRPACARVPDLDPGREPRWTPGPLRPFSQRALDAKSRIPSSNWRDSRRATC